MTDTLINGRREDRIAADDRGLLYGDHLFETIAFHGRHASLWADHLDRLQRSAGYLGLPVPAGETLLDECRQLCRESIRQVIRITLTRGSGGQAYAPPERPQPRRIVQRRPWPRHLAGQRRDGLRVMISPVHLASGSMLAGLKHGNRLEQVLAARNCHEQGCDEALLLDAGGDLVEAIAGNIVVLDEHGAWTPPVTHAGVAGVGLGWLRRQPEVSLGERRMTPDDLARADALAVINSVAGVRPVHTLDGRPLAVDERIRHWQQLWRERLG